MARMRTRRFRLILVDREQRIFNIVGPMTDDTDWTNKVVEEQQKGRQVNCQTVSAEETTEEIAERYAEATGYEFSQDLIMDEPEDSSIIYGGRLPKYAERADRRRVVHILCKVNCGKTRWAEMDQDFPGVRVLRQSDLGDFTARCLYCGGEARDCYNWYR